jgi:hypothetical protein
MVRENELHNKQKEILKGSKYLRKCEITENLLSVKSKQENRSIRHTQSQDTRQKVCICSRDSQY